MKWINKCVTKLSTNVGNNEEKVKSLNSQPYLDANTRVLIVGTITPCNGMQYGYFYTSRYNRVYNIIDKFYNNNALCYLKKQLTKGTNNSQIIAQIISTLQNEHIAFLDVIDGAIRKKGSSKDDDIREFTVDYKAFENLQNVQCVICNSQNAFEAFKIIKQTNNLNNVDVVYAAQCRSILYSKDQNKQKQFGMQKWQDTFKKYLP